MFQKFSFPTGKNKKLDPNKNLFHYKPAKRFKNVVSVTALLKNHCKSSLRRRYINDQFK